ncbi:MAG: hypothetical protein KDK34_18200 [Leptospiraceae bacterium]|nr:hypothetical protein [Leptospiraceae bacterium]
MTLVSMRRLSILLIVLSSLSCGLTEDDSAGVAGENNLWWAALALTQSSDASSGSSGGSGNTPGCSGTIRMFVSDDTFSGNLGGKANAGTLCSADANRLSGCTGTVAVLSVAGDLIRDMPTTYNFCSNARIVGSNGTQIADNWSDLLDGTTDATLAAAMTGGVSAPQSVHSGSLADGSLSTGNNCSNYGSTAGNNAYGATNNAAQSIYSGSTIACTSTIRILCLCY